MLNTRFISYFRDTFFQGKDAEFEAFTNSIELSIPRTIRIRPGKEESVITHLERDGWILTPTNVSRVYSVDRREDFDPLERRLGFSYDHLVGNFYIQELAAAHPVDILAGGEICHEPYLILDMASSPGGKTTQLTEYYPESCIIANEPTRERIPQLLQNTERMGAANIGITLYPGQLWKNYRETFDRILLDAPCSGEGTLYKGTDAVRHWHLKNIKEIAKLQTKLLDAAIQSLKVGGEMIYSTCALNLLENEGVVDTIREKYPDTFEILYQKKFWPHIDKTGGFFVTKIRKIASIPAQSDRIMPHTSNRELRVFRGNTALWKLQPHISLYEHEGKILAVTNPSVSHALREEVYLMRFGEQIGNITSGRYVPSNRAWKYLDVSQTPVYEIHDEHELDAYLRGEILHSEGSDEPLLISYEGQTLGLEYRRGDEITNTFSSEWRRK